MLIMSNNNKMKKNKKDKQINNMTILRIRINILTKFVKKEKKKKKE
jgi:hypothetical protein